MPENRSDDGNYRIRRVKTERAGAGEDVCPRGSGGWAIASRAQTPRAHRAGHPGNLLLQRGLARSTVLGATLAQDLLASP